VVSVSQKATVVLDHGKLCELDHNLAKEYVNRPCTVSQFSIGPPDGRVFANPEGINRLARAYSD
jgi:hypothetical protein